MSLPVSNLVNDAAIAIGDPNKTRVKMSEWTSFYSRAARELCSKANVLQQRATFNLGTQQAYHFPDDMTTMSKMEVSETPTDGDSWRVIREIFEDEFRSMTSGRYSDNTLPEMYFADRLGFYLVPRPTATIVDGGRITYFGLPDAITDATTATYQLPEFTRDYILRRMIVFGLAARNRHAEAEAELRQWFADVEDLQDKMADRSDDRRSSLAPRRSRYQGMR